MSVDLYGPQVLSLGSGSGSGSGDVNPFVPLDRMQAIERIQPNISFPGSGELRSVQNVREFDVLLHFASPVTSLRGVRVLYSPVMVARVQIQPLAQVDAFTLNIDYTLILSDWIGAATWAEAAFFTYRNTVTRRAEARPVALSRFFGSNTVVPDGIYDIKSKQNLVVTMGLVSPGSANEVIWYGINGFSVSPGDLAAGRKIYGMRVHVGATFANPVNITGELNPGPANHYGIR